jgi:hypothetical protein
MANTDNLTAKGRGRPKGSPNKTSKAVKDVILEAADGLGGAQRLLEWAQSDPKNEAAFWASIYPRLLPKEVTGEGGKDLIPSRIEIVGVVPK